MDFAQAANKETLKKFTENGAKAFNATGYSTLLDLYAVAGALRTRDGKDISEKIISAAKEDLLLALKMMFYVRDVRGGLGERRTFRVMLKTLAERYPDELANNLVWIPFFGRWDDLYVLMDTVLESVVWNILEKQIQEDLVNYSKGNSISLLAKWLPSINASSQTTKLLGKRTAKKFGLDERTYRKTLSALRAHLDVVERKMSKKDWDEIEYSQVPSKAMNNYYKAFYRNNTDRFDSFVNNVKKGVETVKAATLYPYDIIEKLDQESRYSRTKTNELLEEQWKALPNYVTPGSNVIIMADVSGSMQGRPIYTSAGLAIYFAERNVGAYHNLFMTFSSNPHFIKLKGETLYEKLVNTASAEWQNSTNLEAAFLLVLNTAIENSVKPEEMPKAIVVISDMEINACTIRHSHSSWSFYDTMVQRFASYGYNIPNIIFWNVNARQDTFLVDSNRKGVQLLSGQSVSCFKNLMNGIDQTPYQAMLQVLNSDRYSCITI